MTKWIYDAPLVMPHASQFVRLNDGTLLRGGCTLIGTACADILAKGLDPSSAHLQQVTHDIYYQASKMKMCGSNGSARQSDMLAYAKRIGLPVLDVLPYQEPMPAAKWQPFLDKYTGRSAKIKYPILVQWANGAALTDGVAKTRDEAGLRYHAGCIYGTAHPDSDPDNFFWVTQDGDNSVISTRAALYSPAVMAAALPISMIAFNFVPNSAPKSGAPGPVAPPIKPSTVAVKREDLASVLASLNSAVKLLGTY